MTSSCSGRDLLVSLIGILLSVPAAANPLTRSASVDAWRVDCKLLDTADSEECIVSSEPHVERIGSRISGYSFLVNAQQQVVSVESRGAVALEARVDGGRVFSTGCAESGCAFAAQEGKSLLRQMGSGRVLFTRLTTADGVLTGRHSLDDFQSALAVAKLPAAVFPRTQLSRVELEMLQSLLAKQGFEPGPLDGVMGPLTRGAIVAYQRASSLAPDGRATQSLLRRLQSAD